MDDETVIITKVEYEALVKSARWLSCLQAAGVDNWDGYSYARELQRESEEN